jgi:hypothetical protein
MFVESFQCVQLNWTFCRKFPMSLTELDICVKFLSNESDSKCTFAESFQI